MKKITDLDCYVTCHICKKTNNVDSVCRRIIQNHSHGRDWAGQRCLWCKTIFSVVITIQGVNTIENLLLNQPIH